jgi:hypothetical protein
MVSEPMPERALFEVLNAKKLSSEEIAASFVISPQFEKIIGPDHSFLIGPRGSGKTTLLRMLQGETLMFWTHKRAQDIRDRVRYSSIFVPADQLWSSQFSGRKGEAGSPNPNRESLGLAAFTTQVLAGLIETLQYRTDYFERGHEVHQPASLSDDAEFELVLACSKAWDLQPVALTLNALLTALDLRFQNIALALESARDIELRLKMDERFDRWIELSPVNALRFGIRTINRLTAQPHHRWALLLDEMELAPASVHRALTQNIRGGEQSLVLKMSFSPFDNFISAAFQGVGAATPDNDFRPIYLWSGDRRGGRKFAAGMFSSIWYETFKTIRDPSQMLGPSMIDASGRNGGKEDYAAESPRMKLIQRMNDVDPSFAQFLLRRGIDLSHPEKITYNQRSSTLRKAHPLLVFREALLNFDSGMPKPRGRKKIDEVFGGEDVVYACLEGNPRWMKAVFGQMISSSEGVGRIPYGAQYDALKDAADRFQALLGLLATGSGDGRSRVLPIIDAISRYFNRRALGEFSADGPTTFVVDEEVGPEVHAALRVALNAGAIVHIRGTKSPAVLSDLTGERFRIAFLLAIRDGLEIPLRLGKSVHLSRILQDPASSQFIAEQLPFFDEAGGAK